MPANDVHAALAWRAENVRSRPKRAAPPDAVPTAGKSEPAGDPVTSWRARREKADALKAEVEAQRADTALQRERGRLVEINRMTLILASTARQIINVLDGIPVALRRRAPGVTPDVLRVLDAEITKARNMAADLPLEVDAK